MRWPCPVVGRISTSVARGIIATYISSSCDQIPDWKENLVTMSIPFTFSEAYEIHSESVVDIDDGKTKWVLTSEMKKDLPKIYSMELRKDDVWLLGYPKSGNTWASEMIYTVYYGGTKEAKERKHLDRYCFPEMGSYQTMGLNKMPEEYAKTIKRKDFFKQAVEDESPRFFRTHLPLSLLPPQLLNTCKVVYICRNLRDVAVSMFKMTEETSMNDSSSMEEFVLHHFLLDDAIFSPACEFIKEAWNRRHHPNMYFLFYEDMTKDLAGVLHKMAAFLGKSLSEEQVKELKDHLSVESMRPNKNINMDELKEMGLLGENSNFIRKGISGDWKNYFTPAIEEEFNKWIDEKMSGSDFQFRD